MYQLESKVEVLFRFHQIRSDHRELKVRVVVVGRQPIQIIIQREI